MRIKAKTKIKDTIITIFFLALTLLSTLGFGIFLLVVTDATEIRNYSMFINYVDEYGDALIFSIFFISVGIFLCYGVIYSIIKSIRNSITSSKNDTFINIEKKNEETKPKKKNSYWLNFYTPIANFENLLLLPIAYLFFSLPFFILYFQKVQISYMVEY